MFVLEVPKKTFILALKYFVSISFSKNGQVFERYMIDQGIMVGYKRTFTVCNYNAVKKIIIINQ